VQPNAPVKDATFAVWGVGLGWVEYIIEIAFDDMNVGRDGSEKVVGFAVGDVACTYRLLYFARDEEFFELYGERGGS